MHIYKHSHSATVCIQTRKTVTKKKKRVCKCIFPVEETEMLNVAP